MKDTFNGTIECIIVIVFLAVFVAIVVNTSLFIDVKVKEPYPCQKELNPQ